MSLLEITNSSKQIASNETFNYKISELFILKENFFGTFENKKNIYVNNFLRIFLRKKNNINLKFFDLQVSKKLSFQKTLLEIYRNP